MEFKKYNPKNLSFVLKIFLGFFILGIIPLIIHFVYTMNNFDYVKNQVTREILSKNNLVSEQNNIQKKEIEKTIELGEKIIFEQKIKFRNYFLCIFFTCLALFIYLSLKMSKRIVYFTNQMEFVLKQAKNGDYSARVKIDSEDEFSKIGRAFNEMAGALSKARKKELEYLEKKKKVNCVLKKTVKKRIAAEKSLLENQKQLENIVNERTDALKKANQSLVSTIRELNSNRRIASIISKLSDDLYRCTDIDETFIVAGEACSELFSEFSGAVLGYDEKKGFLKPVYQWNSKGVLHGTLPVKKCPAMLYRTNLNKDNEKSKALCPHIQRHDSRDFYCVPVFDMGENIGVISVNSIKNNTEISERKWQEVKTALCAVTDYFKASFINLSLKNRLKIESVQDKLTGLYNRRFMEISLKKEISRAKRTDTYLGVLMFDVDFFKRFNDRFGHEAGDRILSEIGKWLLNNLRKEDIICRYGGEEFLVILPGINPENLESKAELVRKGIENDIRIKYETQLLSVTVSIGGCCLNAEHLNESIVSMADNALYKAKQSGRNRARFCES
jgi:diguanylate cyclase (GGDEF)-like protein